MLVVLFKSWKIFYQFKGAKNSRHQNQEGPTGKPRICLNAVIVPNLYYSRECRDCTDFPLKANLRADLRDRDRARVRRPIYRVM